MLKQESMPGGLCMIPVPMSDAVTPDGTSDIFGSASSSQGAQRLHALCSVSATSAVAVVRESGTGTADSAALQMA